MNISLIVHGFLVIVSFSLIFWSIPLFVDSGKTSYDLVYDCKFSNCCNKQICTEHGTCSYYYDFWFSIKGQEYFTSSYQCQVNTQTQDCWSYFRNLTIPLYCTLGKDNQIYSINTESTKISYESDNYRGWAIFMVITGCMILVGIAVNKCFDCLK